MGIKYRERSTGFFAYPTFLPNSSPYGKLGMHRALGEFTTFHDGVCLWSIKGLETSGYSVIISEHTSGEQDPNLYRIIASTMFIIGPISKSFKK